MAFSLFMSDVPYLLINVGFEAIHLHTALPASPMASSRELAMPKIGGGVRMPSPPSFSMSPVQTQRPSGQSLISDTQRHRAPTSAEAGLHSLDLLKLHSIIVFFLIYGV
ncbi:MULTISPECIES: hypothetical protein [unclassified Rhizobium]|uniref:hypothetical protein n=1 Tax=unclassified Rhizobium TaxID=2613769 RepID=UPI0007EC228E|nr:MULTISPECIES: hypothetical protein [unclassified Rhizobium]